MIIMIMIKNIMMKEDQKKKEINMIKENMIIEKINMIENILQKMK